MKKASLLLSALVICLALCACNTVPEGTQPTTPSVTPSATSPAATEPSVAPTEPTDAPTEPTDAPTEPTTAPTEPTTAPTEPTDAPTEPTTAPTEPPVHTHSYGSWETKKAATCTEKGQKQRTCSCGKTETEEIPATGHTEVVDKAVAATCTQTGLTEGKHCSVCNAVIVKQETVAVKEHSFGDWKTVKAATCTEKGSEQRACKTCNHTETREVATIAHSYKDKVCIHCGKEQSASVGLAYKLNSSQTAYAVAGIGSCKDTDVMIPDSYKGLPVTGIEERAFKDCKSLKTVYIPDSVTSVDQEAFSGCTGLTSVTIGNGVTSIDWYAFCDCTGLTSITIPDSVTSIGDWAFEGCTGLTSITIPDSVTEIGSCAFDKCTGLTSITIPDSVTSIDWSAFRDCTSLTSITIPDSVTSIAGSAFEGCTGLTSIEVSAGNPVYHAAENCLIETDMMTLVSGCKNSVIPMDGSVASIGKSAFSGCDGLTSITIPDSVTSIGEAAFYGCSSLTSVTIGSGVTIINQYVFLVCLDLKDIYFNGTYEQWKAIEKGASWDSGMPRYYTVHCTDGDHAES